jgi:predicted nucleic acid-binding protein
MIVVNTSPLYYLHQIGALQVCHDLFGRVHTTPHVLAELGAGKAQGLNVPDASSLEWLEVHDVAMPSVLELVPDLGKGEASVLALAMEHPGSFVIIDDRLGRAVAEAQRIGVTGTLGVLLLAKESNLITSVKDTISDLLKHGFYCSHSVVSHILSLGGESDTQRP